MPLKSPAVVAAEYGISTKELAHWRRIGIGPAYCWIGPRTYRYVSADVDAWFHNPANAKWHDVPTIEISTITIDGSDD